MNLLSIRLVNTEWSDYIEGVASGIYFQCDWLLLYVCVINLWALVVGGGQVSLFPKVVIVIFDMVIYSEMAPFSRVSGWSILFHVMFMDLYT